MPRVKRGVTSHHRHTKILAMTKGHRGTKHRLIRRATESMIHSLSYAYIHRRERKGDMRSIWITRVNAACRARGRYEFTLVIAPLDQPGGTASPVNPLVLF